MNRKSLKKFMSRAGGRISDAHLFMEHIADPATSSPNLPELTLLNLVRQALLSLCPGSGQQEDEQGRAQLQPAPDEGSFRWEHPWVELRYPVEWDFTNPDATLQSPFQQPPAPREDRLRWLIKTTRRQRELLIFEVLTHGAAQRRRAGRNFILPNAHHSELINEALLTIPAELHEKWVEDYLLLLLNPFTVGLMNDFEDEEPDHIVRRLEQVPPVRFTLDKHTEGMVIVQVHPLIVDERTRHAYYPVIAGLSLWPRGTMPGDIDQLLWKAPAAAQLAAWTPKQRKAHWDKVFAALEAIEAPFHTEPEEADDDNVPPRLPTPEVVSVTGRERYLLEGPTRMDKRAATLVAYAHGLNLPRKWTAIRPWHQLVEKEIERLQKEQGGEAFKSSDGKRGKKGNGASLIRRVRPNGDEVIELSDEAAATLAERESLRGFRRVVRDEDGVQREYLIKHLATPEGRLEIRLSWYGMAWPLVGDAIDYQQSSLRALESHSALGQPSLFEELEERRRAEINGMMRQMESIRDARLVMDLILRTFGRDGQNPLHIPAWQLRALLECESDDHGSTRVEGCLRALQEVRFHVKTDRNGPGGKAQSFGPFIGDVKYIARGQGKHTDGDYYLQVSPGAIGCLQVFSTGQYKAANTERVLTYDWNKSLTTENRENLSGYTRGFLTLAPYYDRAKGFSPTQSNLLRWIERELTLNKDAARKSHNVKRAAKGEANAEEPRLYGHDFCPQLPRGLHFYGALGHFSRNPETGRKLQGSERAGTAANESLLSVMGQTLPPKRAHAQRHAVLAQALQDMQAVVEEALGGYAAAWLATGSGDKGRWLSLQDAAEVSEKELLGATWFLFIAPDFRDRLAQDLEKYHAQRHADGKIPYPIRVTHDRHEAHKGHLQASGEHFDGKDGSEPVRVRFKAHRTAQKLSQAKVGELFGVSQKTIDNWEKGPLADEHGIVRGKPIPQEMLPFVLRWIEGGEPPTPEELAGRKTKRSGVKGRN